MAILGGAALVLAACSSSASTAAKHKSSSKPSDVTTTTTQAGSANSSTTTTAASKGGGSSSATAKATTATTPGPCSSSAPGGVLGGSCDTDTPALQVDGAGSNSIGPFYSSVFYAYNQANHNVSVNYNPAGSGTGVTDIENNSVEFADSEVPIAAPAGGNGGAILQLPVDLGGVALSYNVPGAPNGIHLDGSQLAGIYLCQITNWDQIDSSLPSLTIVPVYRADTSGPGYDLDQYLIDTSSSDQNSPSWDTAIGTTKASTTWPEKSEPCAVGEQLNTGVASEISQQSGAIGYVENAYAQEAGFTNAAVENASGNYVTPSVSSIAAAGSQASNLSASNFNIVNGTGSAYPVANFSWALVYETQPNTDLAIVLGKLFDWVTTTGQEKAEALGYSPLPSSAVSLAHQTLLELQTSSGQKIFTS